MVVFSSVETVSGTFVTSVTDNVTLQIKITGGLSSVQEVGIGVKRLICFKRNANVVVKAA